MILNKAKVVLIFIFFIILFVLSAEVCFAGEDLIMTAKDKGGKVIPYILNYQNLSPQYAIILFPGGSGDVNPHMEGDKLVYELKENFLLRSRSFIVDEEFVTVTTNSTDEKEYIQAIIDDLKRRFPKVRIYLM